MSVNRLWSLPRYSNAKMIKTVREHRGSVTSADVSNDDKFALTTSSDGGRHQNEIFVKPHLGLTIFSNARNRIIVAN